jgi:hypothetical protein
MKNKLGLLLVLALCLSVFSSVSASPASSTTVVSVVEDQSVNVRLGKFPANETFYVYMGFNGTNGINGYLVSKIATNDGGTFMAKFLIPEGLKGEDIIAIRFESKDSNAYWYDWFYNKTGASTTGSVTSSGTTYNNLPQGFPTFVVLEVVNGSSITVQTKYFPENERFAVFMKDGALANKTWYEVDGFDSSEGGIQTLVLSIPNKLQYKEKIAVKFYSLKDGFVTYDLILNQPYP